MKRQHMMLLLFASQFLKSTQKEPVNPLKSLIFQRVKRWLNNNQARIT